MRVTATLFFLGAACTTQAQGWFPPQAVWNYSHLQPGLVLGNVHIEMVADTVVGMQPCHRLRRTFSGVYLQTSEYTTQVLGDLLAYENAGLVQAYDTDLQAFDTLYNMNAAIGDSWQLPTLAMPYACAPYSYMLVVDTGTRHVNDIPLRWLAVEIHYLEGAGGDWVVPDTILERVGTKNYMLPYDLCNSLVNAHEGGRLFCYRDAEIVYETGFAPYCDYLLSETELTDPASALRVYPNPGTNTIHLSLSPRDLPALVYVYDLAGRKAAEQLVHTSAEGLDVPRLAPGSYTLIALGRGERRTTKWIKL
jgi:hypothetical protein